jgi:hypothetical protein
MFIGFVSHPSKMHQGLSAFLLESWKPVQLLSIGSMRDGQPEMWSAS